MTDQTGWRPERPRLDLRSAWYAACNVSEDDACHHTIRSASARRPATSYQPRTIKSLPLVAASMAPTSFSASPGGGGSMLVRRKTDHMVYRMVSLISRGLVTQSPPGTSGS